MPTTSSSDKSSLEAKLTPAARETLDQFVASLRSQILLAARDSATTYTGEVREISVNDIISSAGRVHLSKNATASSRTEIYLRLYFALGAALAAASALWFLFQSYIVNLQPIEQLPILLFLAGLGIAGASMFIIRNRQPSSPRPIGISTTSPVVDPSIEFLSSWQEIELALRSAAARELGESRARRPLTFTINALASREVITQGDAKLLISMLETRNRLVHKQYRLDEETLSAMRPTQLRVLRKLRALS